MVEHIFQVVVGGGGFILSSGRWWCVYFGWCWTLVVGGRLFLILVVYFEWW